jgi:hypothetical protein
MINMKKEKMSRLSNYSKCIGPDCSREGKYILEVAIETIGSFKLALCDKCINLFQRLKDQKFKRHYIEL